VGDLTPSVRLAAVGLAAVELGAVERLQRRTASRSSRTPPWVT